MDFDNILTALQNSRKNALAKYSGFHVGAVVVTNNGKMYSGFNIESSSYSLTICAERVALYKALTEGETNFKEIYIQADYQGFTAPCGACRQVLMDYAPGIRVILVNPKGEKKEHQLKDLLPNAFTENELYPGT
ncbi:MAG: cytidine deaminase [Calditrichia bacterium]